MERVIALMEAMGIAPETATPDIFVMATNEVSSSDSLALAESVRALFPQRSVLHNTGAGSLKSQFRKADKSGASVALIVGAAELNDQTVTLKPLLSDTEQLTVPRADLQSALESLLGS